MCLSASRADFCKWKPKINCCLLYFDLFLMSFLHFCSVVKHRTQAQGACSKWSKCTGPECFFYFHTSSLICFLTVQDAMTQCMQCREHQYIFEPVCASVLLRRNTSKEPLRSRHTPRIEGQVQLEQLSLRLSQVCLKTKLTGDLIVIYGAGFCWEASDLGIHVDNILACSDHLRLLDLELSFKMSCDACRHCNPFY